MMRRLLSLFALGLLAAPALVGAPFAALANDQDAGGIEVEDAWIRLPPPGSNAAAYLTLENESEASRTLISASCDRAEVVEVHRTVVDSDVVRMEPVASIELPANGELVFEPRGLHLMLVRPSALAEGEEVSIELGFAGGETVVFEAEVRRGAAGEPGHVGHHGGHHPKGHH